MHDSSRPAMANMMAEDADEQETEEGARIGTDNRVEGSKEDAMNLNATPTMFRREAAIMSCSR